MAKVVLPPPSLTQGIILPFDLNMTICSNIVIFDVMSCVHPLSGVVILGKESLQMMDKVCLVFVNKRDFCGGTV